MQGPRDRTPRNSNKLNLTTPTITTCCVTCGRSKYSGGGGNSLVPGSVQASHASRARAGRSRQCQSKWADPRVSALGTALATAPFLFCPAGL